MSEEKKKVLNRLRRTEGQIRGIQKMIDEEKECIDVITQLSAVRSCIDRVMGMLVAENLKHCFDNPEK
ncbi:metal-sensitive transcriptional regulator, partial [Enterococcus faecalis]|uniref:metal-sensitive transcriptional regulator n=1 Tax=Enterococcus faecalis TaxID=1351 RepID=UPI003CC6C6A0